MTLDQIEEKKKKKNFNKAERDIDINTTLLLSAN